MATEGDPGPEAQPRRLAEALLRLRGVQRVETVALVAGGLAHDINNILQVVMGNLEVARLTLAREGASDAALRAVDAARHAAKGTREAVQHLLSQGSAPAYSAALDVNAVIGDFARVLALVVGERARIEIALAPAVWPIYADRHRLESALLHLALNARDAMDGGGVLAIASANEDVPAGNEARLPAGAYVCVSVRDTGTGIAREHLSRVPEPFFTTKDPRTAVGLGLAAVQGFARQSRGHLRVESMPGAGTTVRLYLARH